MPTYRFAGLSPGSNTLPRRCHPEGWQDGDVEKFSPSDKNNGYHPRAQGVFDVQWSAVITLYPDQFVYLEDINSHMDNGQLFVDELALIRPVDNDLETWEAFKSAHGRRFIYHTSRNRIVMDVVTKPLIRALEP